MISLAIPTKAALSIPPLTANPMGTSLRSRFVIPDINCDRNNSTSFPGSSFNPNCFFQPEPSSNLKYSPPCHGLTITRPHSEIGFNFESKLKHENVRQQPMPNSSIPLYNIFLSDTPSSKCDFKAISLNETSIPCECKTCFNAKSSLPNERDLTQCSSLSPSRSK